MPVLILLITIFISFSIGITYLLHKTVKPRFVKYLPGILPLSFILYGIIQTEINTEGMAQLAWFLNVLLFSPSLFAILLTGLILDHKDKKKN